MVNPLREGTVRQEGERLLIKLDPGGPIELTGLSESFAALARIYERHYRASDNAADSPKLYITRLKSGSVFAEIARLSPLFGYAYLAVDGSTVIADFARRLNNGIRAFADIDQAVPDALPSHDDASDLREFVKPLTGKSAASLGITHARYLSRDGKRETVAEYAFDSAELNRAAINMDNIPESLEQLRIVELKSQDHVIRSEVMLFFEQASRSAAREGGRTGDKAIIPAIDDKSHPTYFRKGINDLKSQMIKGVENPITSTFVVDVHVQYVDGKIKGYLVTDVHKVIPGDGD